MMYKWMNDQIWKIEEVGDGTVNIRIIEPHSEEYAVALAQALPDATPA